MSQSFHQYRQEIHLQVRDAVVVVVPSETVMPAWDVLVTREGVNFLDGTYKELAVALLRAGVWARCIERDAYPNLEGDNCGFMIEAETYLTQSLSPR